MTSVKPEQREPEHEVFAVYLGTASDQISDDFLPTWLRELCNDGYFDRILEEFELPASARNELIAIVLALDLSLSVPAGALAPVTQTLLRRVEAQLARLKASMVKLEPRLPPGLGIELKNDRRMSDGGMSFEVEPGIVPKTLQVLDEFGAAIADIPSRPGRRASFILWANTALTGVIERFNPRLPVLKRAALADDLFADVRRRHGHQSRADSRDEDEVPRSRDMVRRIGAARAPIAARKTRPKKP